MWVVSIYVKSAKRDLPITTWCWFVCLFVWSKSLIACKQDLVLLGFYSRRADSQAKSLKTNLFKLLVSWWWLLIFFTCRYPDSVLFRNSISTHGKYPYCAGETLSLDFDKFYSLAAFSFLLKTCDMFILKVLVLHATKEDVVEKSCW